MFGKLVTPATMLAKISGAIIILSEAMKTVGPHRFRHHMV
jgi:hypothetical protein